MTKIKVVLFLASITLASCNYLNRESRNDHPKNIQIAKRNSMQIDINKLIKDQTWNINKKKSNNENTQIPLLTHDIKSAIKTPVLEKINTKIKIRSSISNNHSSIVKEKVLYKGVKFEVEVERANTGLRKEINTQNFISYGKLQGLEHDDIRCMSKDGFGNLWFGTYGSGIGKYDGYNFTNYRFKYGVSRNYIWCMEEDKRGNLWFGTGNGLFVYDGIELKHVVTNKNIENARIYDIIEDPNGVLWIGTENGLVRKDDKYSILITSENGLNNDTITCLELDKQGRLWIGNGKSGVTIYDGIQFRSIETNLSNMEKSTNRIICDKDKIWIGTDNGLFLVKNDILYKYKGCDLIQTTKINQILRSEDGSVWLATKDKGIVKLTDNEYYSFSVNEGLKTNLINDLCFDDNDNLWIATYNAGLCRYDGNKISHVIDINEQIEKNILSISQDNNGDIWFGTLSNGLIKYTKKKVLIFDSKDDLANNTILSLCLDKQGRLWIGTGHGVSLYDGKTFSLLSNVDGLSNEGVFDIIEDSKGNMWFATHNSGACKFDGQSFSWISEKQGLTSNTVTSILEDKNGSIWFGTNNGATNYDGNNIYRFGKREGLTDNIVYDMVKDAYDNIWFCTDGEGLFCYDKKRFHIFREQHGLGSSYVLSALEDKEGNLWFGTRLGLTRLDYDKIQFIKDGKYNSLNTNLSPFVNYGYDHGFQGIDCWRNSIKQSADGGLWIGANNRLSYVDVKKLLNTIKKPPVVQINQLKLHNDYIHWNQIQQGKDTSFQLANGIMIKGLLFDSLYKWRGLPSGLKLSHKNNYVTFNFVAISLVSTKDVMYTYILDGLDQNWSVLSNQPHATFGNLPPGDYTFKVKAMSNEGVWSKEEKFSFVVLPPWWQTIWAIITYIISFFSAIFGFIKLREKKMISKQIELEDTIKLRTAEVLAEKKLSEELLLNILPAEVASELKLKGHTDARQFEDVTVMFSDFVGFTEVSESLSPKELVSVINTYFTEYDRIIEYYKLEKIKTIGDSYMCVGGLHLKSENNVISVIDAALEIQSFTINEKEKRKKLGQVYFEARVGVHTGPVVAGIVGTKKYAYDIWGDTVNIASRMESSGKIGEVNISEATYQLVKYYYKCHSRGKIEAKNKGKIEMYFVERKNNDFFPKLY